MITVHAIQTGLVQIKQSQMAAQPSRLPSLLNILFSSEWSDWLPIYAWVIEHPEGIFVVDTGETAKTGEPGYLPFHPYFKLAVRFDVKPEDEIGPQLRQRGIDPEDVKTVIMTHLHTDHAGGLHHFPNSEIWIDAAEYQAASGLSGRINGYLPQRWPEWLQPTPIRLEERPFGPFPRSQPVTADGAIVIVPTPGHTATHLSVIVQTEEIAYFLAGDTSYTEALMKAGQTDGLSTPEAHETLRQIQTFAQERPTIYLPSHDPGAGERLATRQTVV